MGSCGRCHQMPADEGYAWCDDCRGESSGGAYVAGVHVSQLDPSETRDWGCTCPIGRAHADTCPVMFA